MAVAVADQIARKRKTTLKRELADCAVSGDSYDCDSHSSPASIEMNDRLSLLSQWSVLGACGMWMWR